MNEILKLLQDKKFNKARSEILKHNPADIADIIEEAKEKLGTDKAIILFRMLPKSISVEVFSYISVESQVEIINGITDREIQYIMDDLYFDDMIDVLEELPANIVDRILNKADKETRKLINTYLNYPETSAGSLMTIDYIGLKKEMTVLEALNHIKKNGMDKETVYTCYVMDSERKLEGIVSLRTLVVSDDNKTVEELMHRDIIRVQAFDDREYVAQVFKKYDFIALPVTDSEDRLVGIITFDDILDVIDEENTEDFQIMAGIAPSKEGYFENSVIDHARQRIVWLLVLMCSSIVTGFIISKFETALSQVMILVSFMPMIMGTGGNAGAQASTLVIRGIAVGDIELSDVLHVIWKEIRVSGIVGIILSFFNFVRIYYFQHESMILAFTVCLALFFVIISAKVIGGTLPIMAKKAGVDPAIMANPLIASLTDSISVIIYFNLAVLLLGIG